MRAITDDMIHMLLERLSKRNITIWTEAGKSNIKRLRVRLLPRNCNVLRKIKKNYKVP